MKRKATAVWKGTGKEGSGHLTTQSTALNKMAYTYKSRFEEGIGTNPEELIAAAHAGCFTMKLSFNLTNAGFIPDLLESDCEINLEAGEIIYSHINLRATVKGISPHAFDELVNDAKINCPVSKLLKTEIEVYTSLINE